MGSFLMQRCSWDQEGSILALHKEEDKDQTSFFLSENFAIILKCNVCCQIPVTHKINAFLPCSATLILNPLFVAF